MGHRSGAMAVAVAIACASCSATGAGAPRVDDVHTVAGPDAAYQLPRPIAASAGQSGSPSSATVASPQVVGTAGWITAPADTSSVARRLDPPSRTVTVAFTGDTLLHSPLVRSGLTANGYDFSPMFAEIAPIVSWADLGICHLETPVAPPGQPLSTYPAYGVPAAIAPALAGAGYDRCSTASNHTMDRGVAGIDATVNALQAAGVAQSGMSRTPQESVPSIFEVNGVRIAHLSYTFGLNGLRLPPGEPWRTNLLDPDALIEAALDARARGAQVVIASIHWGIENFTAVTAEQRRIAERITASGAVDLIVGHHAHVIQPIEQLNGRWVVFGLGNVLSNLPVNSKAQHWSPATQDGMVVSLQITRSATGEVTVSRPVVDPTWVDKGSRYVIRDVLADLDDPALGAGTRQALAASLARTASVVGAFLDPR
ncbi:MAG: CapA family protein [Ilumatobacteraceae bacterium]